MKRLLQTIPTPRLTRFLVTIHIKYNVNLRRFIDALKSEKISSPFTNALINRFHLQLPALIRHLEANLAPAETLIQNASPTTLINEGHVYNRLPLAKFRAEFFPFQNP